MNTSLLKLLVKMYSIFFIFLAGISFTGKIFHFLSLYMGIKEGCSYVYMPVKRCKVTTLRQMLNDKLQEFKKFLVNLNFVSLSLEQK